MFRHSIIGLAQPLKARALWLGDQRSPPLSKIHMINSINLANCFWQWPLMHLCERRGAFFFSNTVYSSGFMHVYLMVLFFTGMFLVSISSLLPSPDLEMSEDKVANHLWPCQPWGRWAVWEVAMCPIFPRKVSGFSILSRSHKYINIQYISF